MQTELSLKYKNLKIPQIDYRKTLSLLLEGELNFHGEKSNYASHTIHAFPAKFPPQLPGIFIDYLTESGDLVVDPMMGSGTTILESNLKGRQAIGFDIDPLAGLITYAKTNPANILQIEYLGRMVVDQAESRVQKNPLSVLALLQNRFDEQSRKFVDYWFEPTTQLELMALINEIEHVDDFPTRAFLQVVFSSLIITKSGGVSLARDLAHTRPHRVTDKQPKSAFNEYRKRLRQNLQGLAQTNNCSPFLVCVGNSGLLPLENNCVDLIVTSPPYASNAIDYMRANKFSLVWFGYSITDLGDLRGKYIGGESITGIEFQDMPYETRKILDTLTNLDTKKAKVIWRYYSEMKKVMTEMYRVLKPGKASIVVVGTSIIRGIDVTTQRCLSEIGHTIGFDVVGIGKRALDRNKRMMPISNNQANSTRIEERMQEEYIIGLMKPN